MQLKQTLTLPEKENRAIGKNQKQVKLPNIESLIIFEGKLEDWPHFRNFFLSLIQSNEGLSDIEKFHYLVSCLKSELLTKEKTLPVTSQNYTIVWDMYVS